MPLAKPLPTTGGTSGEVIQLQEVVSAANLQTMQHRQVQLVGRLRGEHTVILQGRNMAGQRGAYVATPMVERGNTGLAVLVLRGWVPEGSMVMVKQVQRFTPLHELVIHGRLALPKLGNTADAAAERGPVRQNLDLAAFATETDIPMVPLVVLEEAETTTTDKDIRADFFQRRWPELYPQDKYRGHLGWAALAAALGLAGLTVWTWRKRGHTQPDNEPEWESTR